MAKPWQRISALIRAPFFFSLDHSSDEQSSKWTASLLQTPDGALLGLPIGTPGTTEAAGVLIVGLNPRLELNEAYRRFLGLVASQLATALTAPRRSPAPVAAFLISSSAM